VTSAAILDFRIFPEKSEEKKDIKKFVCQNYLFNCNPWTNNHYFIYMCWRVTFVYTIPLVTCSRSKNVSCFCLDIIKPFI
jgi:hypothetical protein